MNKNIILGICGTILLLLGVIFLVPFGFEKDVVGVMIAGCCFLLGLILNAGAISEFYGD